MDDPISALDAHVRKQIINNVYFSILRDRTRVLVTNAIDFLNKADHIVMMEQGKIKAQGSYSELQSRKDFSDLMELNKINKDQVKQEEKNELSRTLSKKLSMRLESKKTKSVFESNQDSFGVSTTNQHDNQQRDPVAMHVHDHDHDDHDCQECKDKEKLEEEKAEDSDSSELPDDYDPDAVAQAPDLKTK